MTSAPYLGDGPETGRAIWLQTPDKVQIRAVIWPQDTAIGTVFILPGRTEHAEKYGPTAALLAQAGFAVTAIDWRGQGLAQRLLPDARKGHVRRFSDYQTDLDTWLAACADLPKPWFMLAHSMGGAIGLRALMRGLPFQAAGFSAPMWGILVPGRRQRTYAALTGLARLLGQGAVYAPAPATGPICYLETGDFADNSLTTDPDIWAWMQGQLHTTPQLCVAGPTLGWLAQALRECLALARLPSPQVPTIVGLGTNERIVDPLAIPARMLSWPQGRLINITGAEHEILMSPALQRDQFLKPVIDLFRLNR